MASTVTKRKAASPKQYQKEGFVTDMIKAEADGDV